MDDHFWVLTYLDDNGNLVRKRFDDEDSAQEGWYNYRNSVFLDEIWRRESRF